MYGYGNFLPKIKAGASVPAAPANIVQPSLVGNGAVGSVVTCNPGAWSGSPSPTFSYDFRVNGISVQSGASNTYTPLIGDDTKTLTCLVTATNTEGSASEGTSNSIVIGRSPVNTVAPTLSPSGTQVTGTLITANVGTWSGTATITYEYKWTRNGVEISGATASTYTIQVADDGTTIRVEVKGTNAYGTSAFVASSNSVSAVNAVAPSNTVAPVISGTAVVGQTLTSTTGTWTGVPTPTYSYQWKRGATNIGTNSSTYTLVQADAGNTSNITCVVTATNAGGSANATSNQIAQILTIRTNSFLTASAISDATIRGGLNTFDIGLISNSLDTKMKAVYPFVGGTASTHRWNFMDARDLDAAFRLSFSGTWTHSATGALPNGTNGYADTFLTPSSIQNVNSNGIGAYITPFTVSGGDATQMGAINSGTQRTFIAVSPTAMVCGANGTFVSSTISGNGGHFSIQKTSSTVTTNYKNSTLLNTFNSGGTLPSLKMFIGTGSLAGNAPYTGGYSNSEFRLAYVNDGLNSSEVTALYNIIQAFQTTLGRQINP